MKRFLMVKPPTALDKLKAEMAEVRAKLAERDAAAEHEREQRVPRLGDEVRDIMAATGADYVSAFSKRVTMGDYPVTPDASTRIPRGESTRMPSSPLVPTPRGHLDSMVLPETRDEMLYLRDRIFKVGLRIYGPLSSLATIAEFGSGLKQRDFEERQAKTPSLKRLPPKLGDDDADRLGVILRNLDPDTLRDLQLDGPLR